MKLTESQADAYKWLIERNRTGLFDKNGVLIAGGERAPFMRSTWNILRDLNLIEIIGKRVNIKDA